MEALRSRADCCGLHVHSITTPLASTSLSESVTINRLHLSCTLQWTGQLQPVTHLTVRRMVIAAESGLGLVSH